MNKEQKILYNLMKDFDDICQRNQIHYILSGGTALGAVRHGGFLPWDDDVDLFITRNEFIKLERVMKKEKLVDREWVTIYNHPTYHNPVARFFDTSTTNIYPNLVADGTPNAFNLEVFVGDPYPDDKRLQEDFNKHLWLYTELQNPYFQSANIKMPDEMLDADLYYYFLRKIEEKGQKAVIDEIEQHLTYDENECESYCGRWSYAPITFHKEWVSGDDRIDFEDTTFPIGKDPIRRLVSNYGDNWQIIPGKNKREVHNTIKYTNLSYQDRDEEVQQLCEKTKYNQILTKKKNAAANRVLEQKSKLQLQAKVLKEALSCLMVKYNNINWSFEYEKIEQYKEVFASAYDLIFSKKLPRELIDIPIHEDVINVMFYTLFYDNRIDRALSLLDYFDSANKDKYIGICNCVREIKIERYENHVLMVKRLLEQADSFSLPYKQLEVERCRVWLMTKENTFSGTEEIEHAIENVPFAGDDEIRKYIGDLYFQMGDIKSAAFYYRTAIKKNKNGILIKEAVAEGFYKGALPNSITMNLLNTLRIFDDICKANSLQYITAGSIPEIIRTKKFKNLNKIEVLMPVSDMLRFVDCFDKAEVEGYSLEYIGNNARYPEFSIVLSCKGTTYYHCVYSGIRENHGLHIEIFPVINSRLSKYNRNRIINRALSYGRQYSDDDLPALKNKVLKNTKGKIVEAPDSYRKKIFQRICNDYAKEDGTGLVRLCNTAGQFVAIRESDLFDIQERKLLGQWIRVPKKLKKYCDKLYKHDEKRSIPDFYGVDVIVSPDIECNDFLDNVHNLDNLNETIMREIKEINKLDDRIQKRKENIYAFLDEAEKLYHMK